MTEHSVTSLLLTLAILASNLCADQGSQGGVVSGPKPLPNQAPAEVTERLLRLFVRRDYAGFLRASSTVLPKYREDCQLLSATSESLLALERYRELEEFFSSYLPTEHWFQTSGHWVARGMLIARGSKIDASREQVLAKVTAKLNRAPDPLLNLMLVDGQIEVPEKLFFYYAAHKLHVIGEPGLVIKWIQRDYAKDAIANEILATEDKAKRPQNLRREIEHLELALKGAKGDRKKTLQAWLNEAVEVKRKHEEEEERLKKLRGDGAG